MNEDNFFACQSVPGGWQIKVIATDDLVGPVFNKTSDLWRWQREYLTTGDLSWRDWLYYLGD